MIDRAPDNVAIEFVVTEAEAGRRLDQLLVTRFGTLGRRGSKGLFDQKSVLVDGRIAKKGDRARAGTRVIVGPDVISAIYDEPDLPLDVVLERANLVIVDKPAGMPTAPIRFGEMGTLAGALLGRYPELRGVGYRAREPGLLHRLDTQTSGLVLATRTPIAFAHLKAALSSGELDKRYLAIVSSAGLAADGKCEAPLKNDPADPRRVIVASSTDREGHVALTRYTTLGVHGRFALVEVSASPAFRHQVRVHLAALGLPIIGDVLYGGETHPALGVRHALHASRLAFAGDATVAAFAATSDLPPDLHVLIARA